MNIYPVLPRLDDERKLGLWHKALKTQWSADEIDWSAPRRLTSKRTLDGLARLLSPVLLGEQAALYSVTSLIPILGHRCEVESQFYLTTWAVDEARHTELFARLYRRLDREPLSILEMPSGYLFQSRIRSEDPGHWLAGVLVSEVAARVLATELLASDLDPVLGEICEGVLRDEARHLAFNHLYLEDLFRDLFREGEGAGTEYGTKLRSRLESVLELVPPVFDVLAADLEDLNLDRIDLYEAIAFDARRRLETSIRRGAKGAGAAPGTAAALTGS